MTSHPKLKKLGRALIFAAPVLGCVVSAVATAGVGVPTNKPAANEVVIIHVAVTRDGANEPFTQTDLIVVSGMTSVQTRGKASTLSVAMCEPKQVANNACPPGSAALAKSNESLTVVATPRVQPDGRVIVDLELQNDVGLTTTVGGKDPITQNLAGIADPAQPGKLTFKDVLTLQPDVPKTESAGTGYTLTATAEVANVTAASPKSVSAPATGVDKSAVNQ